VCRELRRNGWTRPIFPRQLERPRLAGGYRAAEAKARAQACAATSRVERRLRPQTALWKCVMRHLKQGYSPEQIAGPLALVHPDTPSLQVSHQTIYTAIYAMQRGELRTQVIGWLSFGLAKRRPHAQGERPARAHPRHGQHPRSTDIRGQSRNNWWRPCAYFWRCRHEVGHQGWPAGSVR